MMKLQPSDQEESQDEINPCKSLTTNVSNVQPAPDTSIDKRNGNGSVHPPSDIDEGKSVVLQKNEVCTNVGADNKGRVGRGKRPSIVYRRLPENILLKHVTNEEANDVTSVLSDDEKSKNVHFNVEDELVRKCCLNPRFTLRRQMMISFGSLNIITILLVVAICVGSAQWMGTPTKTLLSEKLELKVRGTIHHKGKYLIDAFREGFLLIDTVKLIDEVVMDRFDGHPNPSDDWVPFFDMETKTNIYPITGKPMPILWDVEPNVNEENYEEFVQSRWYFFEDNPVDTRNAGFHIQGSCDPSETDPMRKEYVPNCTDANNEIRTGGVFAYSEETEMYHRKGSDLVPILRGLFENREEIREIYIHFLNNGAGAGILYPHYAPNQQLKYTSDGCDWLLQPNPYKASKKIGTESMIQNCRKKDTIVPNYLYNAIEREWCKNQALSPDTVLVELALDTNSNTSFIRVGKSVYDRTSKEFLACMYIGISLDEIQALLKMANTQLRDVNVLIGYHEEGYIVSSSSENFTRGETRTPIYEAGLGVAEESYAEFFNLVDFDSFWDPNEVKQQYEEFSINESTKNDKYIISIEPMPVIPSVYDKSYRPGFFFISFFYKERFQDEITEMQKEVEQTQSKSTVYTTLLGVAGIVIAVIIIFIMAYILTSPLTTMNNVATDIADNFGDSKKEDGISQTRDDLVISRCTPKTELSDVVCEFNKMVASFGGASEAKSEKHKDDDMLNNFPARSDFLKLYESRSTNLFKYNLTGERMQCYHDSNRMSYMHLGPNHTASAVITEESNMIEEDDGLRAESRKWSPLFFWILLLLVTPLLCIHIIISARVIEVLNQQHEEIESTMKNVSLTLAGEQTVAIARLRSEYLSKLTEKSTDDLSLLSRYSSWLLFGALNQSDSFTRVSSAVEDCKIFSGDFSQCDLRQKDFVCDCEWQERGFEATCTNYNESVRRSEVVYWTAEVSENVTGDRFSSDFPNSSVSPQTTNWWDNAMTVPGFQKGSSASGYDTSYDRLRIISAVPIFQPLQHYRSGISPQATLQASMSFEADGMMVFYAGCDSAILNAAYSNWTSTAENKAAEFRPELCQVGKYGYDPR